MDQESSPRTKEERIPNPSKTSSKHLRVLEVTKHFIQVRQCVVGPLRLSISLAEIIKPELVARIARTQTQTCSKHAAVDFKRRFFSTSHHRCTSSEDLVAKAMFSWKEPEKNHPVWLPFFKGPPKKVLCCLWFQLHKNALTNWALSAQWHSQTAAKLLSKTRRPTGLPCLLGGCVSCLIKISKMVGCLWFPFQPTK